MWHTHCLGLFSSSLVGFVSQINYAHAMSLAARADGFIRGGIQTVGGNLTIPITYCVTRNRPPKKNLK